MKTTLISKYLLCKCTFVLRTDCKLKHSPNKCEFIRVGIWDRVLVALHQLLSHHAVQFLKNQLMKKTVQKFYTVHPIFKEFAFVKYRETFRNPFVTSNKDTAYQTPLHSLLFSKKFQENPMNQWMFWLLGLSRSIWGSVKQRPVKRGLTVSNNGTSRIRMQINWEIGRNFLIRYSIAWKSLNPLHFHK